MTYNPLTIATFEPLHPEVAADIRHRMAAHPRDEILPASLRTGNRPAQPPDPRWPDWVRNTPHQSVITTYCCPWCTYEYHQNWTLPAGAITRPPAEVLRPARLAIEARAEAAINLHLAMCQGRPRTRWERIRAWARLAW